MGHAKAAKAYKVKVASLTSERSNLRTRVQSLTEEAVKLKSDLRHTSTAKARAKDKETKAREGLRVAEGELRVVRKELQAAEDELRMARGELQTSRDELRSKAVLLDQACCEVSEAESSIECLIDECSALRGDLQRKEALVVQRDGAIAGLRDEACTLWAFGWLAFQRRAAKAFLGLDLNFQVPSDEEAEESFSEDEGDPKVFSDAPRSADCPGEPEAPAEASSPSWPVGASSFVHSPVPDD